jgi:hypothetical protein
VVCSRPDLALVAQEADEGVQVQVAGSKADGHEETKSAADGGGVADGSTGSKILCKKLMKSSARASMLPEKFVCVMSRCVLSSMRPNELRAGKRDWVSTEV